MRGITYQFTSFEELSLVVEAGGDEQDLELPLPKGEFADSDWVIATFAIAEDTTSIAACVVDRGLGLRLAFEDRDWKKLWKFANRGGPPTIPPSIPPSMPPPASTENVSAVGNHILVVDTDIETQTIVTELLESSGYIASPAPSAEVALETLRALPIDLVLVEWTLPGMSGLEFCRLVRKNRKFQSLPLVFLTTHSASTDVMQAFEVGADDYITKPFRALELSARVMGLLRRSRMPAHRS